MAIVCNAPNGILRRVVLAISYLLPHLGKGSLHVFVVTESFDKSRSKDVGNRGTDVGQHDNTQPDVRFRVDEYLNNLVPLPFPSSSTSLIRPQSLVCHLLFSLGQEPTSLDIAVEEEPDEWCGCDGDDSSNEVKGLPCFEVVGIDVALIVRTLEWGRETTHETECEDTCKDGSDTVGSVPSCDSKWLLGSSVPLGSD